MPSLSPPFASLRDALRGGLGDSCRGLLNLSPSKRRFFRNAPPLLIQPVIQTDKERGKEKTKLFQKNILWANFGWGQNLPILKFRLL
jgi:hypothetical protein